ncbi:MAG: hypothetical protein ACK4SX_09885 [Alcanivoracaceae bacterium]
MKSIKNRTKYMLSHFPALHGLAKKIYFYLFSSRSDFKSSENYWKERYQKGGDSGEGSYNKFAIFKSDVINEFTSRQLIDSAIEHGCGDGNQLGLLRIPTYIGIDISHEAIAICREKYKNDQSKSFFTSDEILNQKAEMGISLDVIYHLVEESTYRDYLNMLFDSSTKYVVIYSSNTDQQDKYQGKHVYHREFTCWVEENRPEWVLIDTRKNIYPYRGDDTKGSFSDFYFFEKAKITAD